MDKQNYELAEEDYMNGMKYKDIAEKYNVSINTVKSWKTRYKWCKDNKKGMHTKEEKVKKVCTQNKKSAENKKQNKKIKEEPIADEVKEVMENEELNDRQRLFCIFYSKCFNATKAYLKAYTCTYETAMVAGPRLLGNVRVKEQIDELTKIRFNKEALKSGILQKYIDIAFADITEYVTFGQEEYEVKDDKGNTILDDDGDPLIRKYSYVRPNESVALDGTLISEVSQGKDGIKIKLADKMKALDFLNKHLNLLSDEDKIKLDIANKRLQNEKLQLENDKLSNKGKDEKINIVIKRKERE